MKTILDSAAEKMSHVGIVQAVAFVGRAAEYAILPRQGLVGMASMPAATPRIRGIIMSGATRLNSSAWYHRNLVCCHHTSRRGSLPP